MLFLWYASMLSAAGEELSHCKTPNLSPKMLCFVSMRAAARKMYSRLLWRGPRCDADVPALQGMAGLILTPTVHAGKGNSWEVLFFPATFAPGLLLQQERVFTSDPVLSPWDSPEMRALHNTEQSSVEWAHTGARGWGERAPSCGYSPCPLSTAAGGCHF